MTALLLALVSSASYGASDFLASRVTKRLSPVLLVLYSQAAQGLVVLVLVLAVRQPFAPVGLSWGAAAGALIAIALLGYYQALAIGPTAVVAPLAASGAVVPVLVDLARGAFPGVPALVGVLVVGTGIVLTTLATSREPTAEPAPPWRGRCGRVAGRRSGSSTHRGPSSWRSSRPCCSGPKPTVGRQNTLPRGLAADGWRLAASFRLPACRFGQVPVDYGVKQPTQGESHAEHHPSSSRSSW